MKLRFGIREKFALLAFALVLLAALALPKLLFRHTHSIVEEHELVDLQDEAQLRCWELIDSVKQLRIEVKECVDNDAQFAILKAFLKDARPKDSLVKEGEQQWWRYILAVEVHPPSGPPQVIHRSKGMPSAEIPSPLLASARLARYPRMSPIVSNVLPGGFDYLGPGPADGAPAQPRRVAMIWVACQMQTDDPTQVGPVLAMLVSLDRGSSPRHFSFLLDEKGSYLQHPYASATGEVADVYEGHGLFEECKAITAKNGWGRGPVEQQAQTQRADRPRYWALKEPLRFLEGKLDAGLHAKLNKEMETNRDDVMMWTEALRTGFERRGVSVGPATAGSNVVRMLARSSEDLETVRADVASAYRSRLGDASSPIAWNSPVELKHGDVQFTRFYLRDPQFEGSAAMGSDPPYYFAYAAFREELASAIIHEMEVLQRAALLLSLVAAAVAFAAAFYFVRPLSRIAETAKSVSENHNEVSQMQLQIQRLREALPVMRSDETGDVARALETLLRQILNSHEQLRQLNADLDNRVREQTSELREANDQLRGLAQAKDAFLASVSHELRQPLNSIFGFLQFLEISDLDTEQQHDLGKLRSAATYLRRLIDDILDYQKIIMGGVELDPEEMDAAEFFIFIRESMMPQAQERNNQLELVMSENLGKIHNDRARLQQVLTNLISNACKFTQSGTVTLAARRETDATAKDWLTLEVSDTGRGMKPEEMQGLFVRFKKLSAREGNKTGTGLGLVISKGLCELMGGGITCRSEFGKGTTFVVRVPAVVPKREESAAPRRTSLTPEPASQPAKLDGFMPPPGTEVLVIDDDSAVRELMTRYLEGKGYRILTANDGQQGFEMAKKHRPAVITLDVVLPGAHNGWDILTLLKNEPTTTNIPVVLVTFLDDPKHGFALGAADYITKPIAWEELLASLQKITRANTTDPVLVVDDDADVRELLRRTLARDNMTVIEASNGAEALQRLRQQKPSCILLDLMMPVMDGFEFIAEFHCHPEWSDIPVIVITAKHITREDRERLALSARSIIEKSGFTQELLLGKVLDLVHFHASNSKPPSQS